MTDRPGKRPPRLRRMVRRSSTLDISGYHVCKYCGNFYSYFLARLWACLCRISPCFCSACARSNSLALAGVSWLLHSLSSYYLCILTPSSGFALITHLQLVPGAVSLESAQLSTGRPAKRTSRPRPDWGVPSLRYPASRKVYLVLSRLF